MKCIYFRIRVSRTYRKSPPNFQVQIKKMIKWIGLINYILTAETTHGRIFSLWFLPGDFRCWESPQTLLALFIGSFEHVERFRNLKFAVIRITDIQSTVLSSSEGITAIHLAFE